LIDTQQLHGVSGAMDVSMRVYIFKNSNQDKYIFLYKHEPFMCGVFWNIQWMTVTYSHPTEQ
jgi:hypothetical protein